MKPVVTHLDDDLHAAFLKALGDVPVAKGLRRLVREFVEKSQQQEGAKK
jgi:hypothetical protein